MRKAKSNFYTSALLFLLLVVTLDLTGQDAGILSARELYLLGSAAQTEQDYYRAIELYRESLGKNPAYIEPMIGTAECYRMLDEYEEALSHVTAARKLSSGRTDLINLEARIRMSMGGTGQAAGLFSSVLEREPYNLDARLGLAELAIAEGKVESAEKRYLDIISTARSDRKALLSLFLLYDSLGKDSAAERYLDTALRFHPEDPQVQYFAGLFYSRRNDLTKASLHAQTAVALNPDLPGGILLSGKVALRRGEFTTAERLMRESLQKNAANPEAWFVLAQASLARNDVAGAIQSFERSIRLSPEEEILRLALEDTVLQKLPLEDTARTSYGAYHFNRGKAMEGRNYFRQAEDEYRRGLMLAPYSVEGRRLYAGILLRNGKPGKHLSELNLLKSLGNTDAEIIEGIEHAGSLLRDTVTVRWGLDREKLVRERYDLAVFFAPDGNRTVWNDADRIISNYLSGIMSATDSLSLVTESPTSAGYADAFRKARASGADFFLLLTGFGDDGTDTSISADLYLARTGTRMASFEKNGSGAGRLYRTVTSLAESVSSVLPVRGTLLARDFEKVLFDLGAAAGMEKGRKLLVLQRDTLELRTDVPGFLYVKDDIIGEIEVTAADELVSEGTLTKRGFFDLVKPGDTVIFEAEGRDKVQDATSVSPGLFRRILQVR